MALQREKGREANISKLLLFLNQFFLYLFQNN
jgi:hypothetical protein